MRSPRSSETVLKQVSKPSGPGDNLGLISVRGGMCMGTLRCSCGNVISDVESPCRQLWCALPDEKIHSVAEVVANSIEFEHPTDLANAAIAEAAIPIYKCDVCGRLLVFWNGTQCAYSSYVFESPSEEKSSRPSSL